MIHEVEEGKEYALLMSTNAGAWRYLIGDTIKFVDVEHSEVVITGRTKHFLSLTGEHLSVENMNKAIELVSEELNISIPEYTVVGFPHQNKRPDETGHSCFLHHQVQFSNRLFI